ncbi:MAG: hypothetical protein WB444_13880 [Gallionella sp.]
MKIPVLGAILFLLVTFPAYAEWSKAYEVDYVMGDGDNKAGARQAAIEQIKLKASNEAGTYIQGTTTMRENGELTENVQMLSASLVKVGNTEDKLTVNASGQAVLWVKAAASLDEHELVRRVEALQQDQEKARQVKLLQAENEVLYQDLARIRAALATKSDPARTAEFLARQDSTIQRLDDNGNTITQVFARGTLLQLANRSTDAFDKAKDELDEQFLAPIMHSHVTAEIESVQVSGSDYVAMVRVGWTIDTLKLRPVLKRFLKVEGFNGDLAVYGGDNIASRGPNELSERAYQYLATKGVDLRLKIGAKEVHLPVFYTASDGFGERCGLSDRVRGERSDYLCLVSQKAGNPEVRGLSSSDGAWTSRLSNPIRIHLTKEEAARATRVEAVLVIAGIDKAVRRPGLFSIY